MDGWNTIVSFLVRNVCLPECNWAEQMSNGCPFFKNAEQMSEERQGYDLFVLFHHHFLQQLTPIAWRLPINTLVHSGLPYSTLFISMFSGFPFWKPLKRTRFPLVKNPVVFKHRFKWLKMKAMGYTILLMVQKSGDHRLRLVVYPTLCRVLVCTSKRWLFDMSEPSTVCSKALTEARDLWIIPTRRKSLILKISYSLNLRVVFSARGEPVLGDPRPRHQQIRVS